MEGPTIVTDRGFHLWDSMAIELEIGEFLFGVVKALKPKLIVECGTGNGYATEFLATAQIKNGLGGTVVTFESDPGFRERTAEKLKKFPIEFRAGTSEGTDLRPDLVFIDCAGNIRKPVIEFWLNHPDRPVTVIHDARRNYPYHLGEGVYIPGHDGVWIGRAKEN